MILNKMLKDQIFGEVLELSQYKLNFGPMDSTDSMTGLFGKEKMAKRFGACVGFILNSFNVFFLNSGMLFNIACRVGVAA